MKLSVLLKFGQLLCNSCKNVRTSVRKLQKKKKERKSKGQRSIREIWITERVESNLAVIPLHKSNCTYLRYHSDLFNAYSLRNKCLIADLHIIYYPAMYRYYNVQMIIQLKGASVNMSAGLYIGVYEIQTDVPICGGHFTYRSTTKSRLLQDSSDITR